MSARPVPAAGSRVRFALLFVLFAGALAVRVGLGTWQVQRLAWKEALLATIDERIHADPLPLDEVASRYPEIEYVPVTATGRFDHAAERHVFTTWEGESGYDVFTPLLLGGNRAVFVNRGFERAAGRGVVLIVTGAPIPAGADAVVPFDRKDPATRADGQVGGEVTVTGLARRGLAEKPSWVVPDNDPAKNVFYWKDVRAMRETSGLDPAIDVLPFVVDAGDAANPGGLPVGGTTLIDLPNNHLQYAVTWYGLALALCGVFGYRLWSLRKRTP